MMTGRMQCLPLIEWAEILLVHHALFMLTMPIDRATRRLISGSASRLIVQLSVGNYLLSISFRMTLSLFYMMISECDFSNLTMILPCFCWDLAELDRDFAV